MQQTYLRSGENHVFLDFPRPPDYETSAVHHLSNHAVSGDVPDLQGCPEDIHRPGRDVAFGKARDGLHFEAWLQLDFELHLQSWVLSPPVWVIRLFNQFYENYLYVFYACMVIDMFFAVEGWRCMRRWFFISMAIATPWYAICPLAPPRFMQEYGYVFVDTLKVWDRTKPARGAS